MSMSARVYTALSVVTVGVVASAAASGISDVELEQARATSARLDRRSVEYRMHCLTARFRKGHSGGGSEFLWCDGEVTLLEPIKTLVFHTGRNGFQTARHPTVSSQPVCRRLHERERERGDARLRKLDGKAELFTL